MIPEAAVEAAARAMHADAYPPEYWDMRPDLRHIFTKRAEISLEAAAPHMRQAFFLEMNLHAVQDELNTPLQFGRPAP